MQAEYSDRIVREIMGDICNQERTVAERHKRSTDADFKADFETLIQNGDDAKKAIMRRIMQELTTI